MEIRICFRHSVLYTVLYKQIIFNHKKSWNFLICGLLAEYIWLVRRKRLSPGSFVSIFGFLPNRVLPKLVTTRLFSENILPFKFCKTMSFTFQQFILFERCLLFLIIFFSYTFLARSGIDNCWAQNYNKKYLKIKKPWDRNTCFL